MCNKYFLKIFLFNVIFVFFIGCTPKSVNVKISIKVKDNQGNPIEGATVRVENEQIGLTNKDGTLDTEIKTKLNIKNRVEITKQSNDYFFSPVYDSFVIKNKNPLPVKIEAIMYFVPKTSLTEQPQTPTIQEDKPNTKSLEEEPQQHLQSSNNSSTIQSPHAEQDFTTNNTSVTNSTINPDKEFSETDKHDTNNLDKNLVTSTTESLDSQEKYKAVNDLTLQPVIKKNVVSTTKADYPIKNYLNEGIHVIYIRTYQDSKNTLANVKVYIGEDVGEGLKLICTTNQYGRCSFRYNESKDKNSVTMIAQKEGYQTTVQEVTLQHLKNVSFVLKKGLSIDIFALTKTYNYIKGVEGVKISIKGKKVGTTDKYGFFTFAYDGKTNDLVDIQLETTEYLPEEYTTDFVISSKNITLFKYYTPKNPPRVKIVILSPQSAGDKTLDPLLLKPYGKLDKELRKLTEKYMFSLNSFSPVDVNFFMSKINTKNLKKFLQKGWQDTFLKAHVDAVILPTIISGQKNILDLSIIDSKGKTIAAAAEYFDNVNDISSFDQSIKNITQKLIDIFPFEGTVIDKDDNKIIINIGENSQRGIKLKDIIDVYGSQKDNYGKTQDYTKIGTLIVEQIYPNFSVCSVKSLIPRAIIHRGDLVVLHHRAIIEQNKIKLEIVTLDHNNNKQAVYGANAYFNDIWLGSSDNLGNLYTDLSLLKGKGILRVIKYGFKEASKEINIDKISNLTVILQRAQAFLKIDSKPSGALVVVEGKEVGKTPLTAPVTLNSGFVKLEIIGPPGFKKYSTVLDLEEGSFDLTGANSIELEKDYITEVEKLLKQQKILQAIKILEAIPNAHSDWLLAQHKLGELYANELKQPQKALSFFENVTTHPEVKNFNDKRFIGSFINQAVCLFLIAESLKNTDIKQAQIYYLKAIEVFENIWSQIRFIPTQQHDIALHTCAYYDALSKHRLWSLSKNKAYLSLAEKAWINYLQNIGTQTAKNTQIQALLNNAKVYYNQLKGDLTKN